MCNQDWETTAAVILIGILTTKPLIFIKVQAGRHEQSQVAKLVSYIKLAPKSYL